MASQWPTQYTHWAFWRTDRISTNSLKNTPHSHQHNKVHELTNARCYICAHSHSATEQGERTIDWLQIGCKLIAIVLMPRRPGRSAPPIWLSCTCIPHQLHTLPLPGGYGWLFRLGQLLCCRGVLDLSSWFALLFLLRLVLVVCCHWVAGPGCAGSLWGGVHLGQLARVYFVFIPRGGVNGRKESNQRTWRTSLSPMHMNTELWSFYIRSDIKQPQLSGYMHRTQRVYPDSSVQLESRRGVLRDHDQGHTLYW